MSKSNGIFTFKFIDGCVLAFAITFGMSFILFIHLKATSSKAMAIPENINSDTEIALIYFGYSNCPAATDKKIPVVLKRLSAKVQEAAASKGYRFTLIGTSDESNVEKGLNYLNGIGDFNEISIGNQMRNITLQHYIWDNYSGSSTGDVPQIIITKRTYDTTNVSGKTIISQKIQSEKILVRRVGVNNFEKLIHNDLFFKSL